MKLLLNILLKKKIIFLTRYPSTQDLNDGYFQRVEKIDKVFSNRFRIYFNITQKKSSQLVSWINKDCVQFNLCSRNRMHVLLAQIISIMSGVIYTHSVLRLDTKLARLAYKITKKSVFDIHGVVPEEFEYNNDENGKLIFDEVEAFAVKNSFAIIGVTMNMMEHLKAKHAALYHKQKLYVIPILQKLRSNLSKKFQSQKPTIIYAGGTHKWQQIDKMLNFVYINSSKYNFIFLVTDISFISNRYSKISNGSVFPGMLKCVGPGEVITYYNQAQFGLVLREDIIVNRVSCPTKLVEYMINGLVPIVDSPNIGDFMHLGYQHIKYEDNIDLSTVNVDEICKKNLDIVEKMHQDFHVSLKKLKHDLE